jgi:uncharacterized protein (DUF305 family)
MNSAIRKYGTLFVVLALAAFFAAAACSTATDTNTNSNVATTGVTSPAVATDTASPAAGMSGEMSGMNHGAMQSSPNAASAPYDLQFLDTMVSHHQGAVDMARPAETKAQHHELKELAGNIIRDQEREIAQMKQWRGEWYAGKPQAMNMEMSGMMDSMRGMDMTRLNNASGNAFDVMFLDMMTPHHQGAIVMGREALTKAEHQEIKKLAQQIIGAQEREIAQMSKWKAAWSAGK